MLSRLTLSLAALVVSALSHPVLADPPRAVLELFTSQGCSSCPPADAVLADMARRPEIVALSFPVNYWDYLGWKDTLAHAAFTDRQKAYAKTRQDRQVYTPQMIVNGRKPCVGSDRAKIETSIQEMEGAASGLEVAVEIREQGGTVTVNVGEAAAGGGRSAEVWLLPVLKAHTVPIGRGENRGRTVTYANVVRGMKRLGEWRGETARFEMPLESARAGADGYVVLLQVLDDARPGPIIGAAKSQGL